MIPLVVNEGKSQGVGAAFLRLEAFGKMLVVCSFLFITKFLKFAYILIRKELLLNIPVTKTRSYITQRNTN